MEVVDRRKIVRYLAWVSSRFKGKESIRAGVHISGLDNHGQHCMLLNDIDYICQSFFKNIGVSATWMATGNGPIKIQGYDG